MKRVLFARSGVIRGGDVRLTAVTGEVANVRSLARVEGQNGGHARQNDLVDDAARIEAAGTLEIYAGQDILNLGSVLQSGGALSLAAGRDIAVAAVAAEDKVTGRRYLWQEIQQYAAEVSGQDLDFQAGRDIGIIGSDLIAGRDLSARAGGNLVIAAAADEQHRYSKTSNHERQDDQVRQRGASLNAGNDLTLAAGENQVVIASRLAAGGDMRLVAEGDIALLSASDLDYRYRLEKEKKSFGRSQSEMSEFERGTAVLTELDAQNLTLSAGGGILGEGARLAAAGALKLESMGDIVLSVAENSTRSASAKSRTGFLGLTGEARKQGERQTSVVGTTLVGENIELASAGDMFLQATQLSAETARLVAGGDLAILSAAETTEAYSGKRKRSLSVVHDGLLRQDSIRADWEKSLVAPVGSVLEADVLALQSGGDLMVEKRGRWAACWFRGATLRSRAAATSFTSNFAYRNMPNAQTTPDYVTSERRAVTGAAPVAQRHRKRSFPRGDHARLPFA